MSQRIAKTFRQRSRAESGFSLVELMVSLALGLFLVGGLVLLLVTNSINSAEVNKTGAQIENGRYALQLLVEDVQHAGYLGTYTPPTTTIYSDPDPCATAVVALGFVASAIPQLPVLIYGYDGAAAPPSCTPPLANRIAGTDILVVRRVATTPTKFVDLVTGEVYFQVWNCITQLGVPAFVLSSDSSAFVLQKKDCSGIESIQKYVVHIYYVSSCNVCGTDTIPTLKVAEFIAGAFVITPLVEGIENLQIEYGLDTNGDGAPDCYTSNPTAVPGAESAACTSAAAVAYFAAIPPPTPAKNWSNVAAARIHVLARNVDFTTGWKDNRTYDLGLGASIAKTDDAYKRHVYAATARLYNLSGQRETP